MPTETAKATGGSSVGECQPGFRTRAGPGEDTCEAPWEMGVSWAVGRMRLEGAPRAAVFLPYEHRAGCRARPSADTGRPCAFPDLVLQASRSTSDTTSEALLTGSSSLAPAL